MGTGMGTGDEGEDAWVQPRGQAVSRRLLNPPRSSALCN